MIFDEMIMPQVVCLEDRLGIGQENLDQLINQSRTNKFIYLFIVIPLIQPTISTLDQILKNFKLPSDMNPEFHIIPGRLHWRAYRYV
jgi:hypothetical protein